MSEHNTHTEVSGVMDYGLSPAAIAEGISAGSWAILLFLGVIGVVSWRSFKGVVSDYIKAQTATLETVRANLEVNQQTLAEMHKVDEQALEHLKRIEDKVTIGHSKILSALKHDAE